ncbi:YIP1 family protein [Haloferax sp. Atlit-12N]|uniref:Yip1 family protein n=1 Tax=Haloferax sp. Atlit-12N TaxID=2077203 RepID=UPI000E277928|nr:Yip1 family protein [Haloferax sp. Atlit-12N]RDZ65595.1 YIP1 family protein [Haloferax sp. Atlit-12N]
MAGPRTPLLKPREYFASRPRPLDTGRALAVVALVTLVVAAATGGILVTFTQQLDQQVSVDNPEHAPDWMCENYEEGGPFADMDAPAGCDPSVPEQIDKRLGDLVWQEISWVPWAMLVGVPLFWLFEGAMLHLGTSLVGGEGGFAESLTVAAWGMVPSAARAVALAGYLAYVLPRIDLPSTPEAAVTAMQSALSGFGLITGVVVVITVAWATYVRTYGMARARDLDVESAAVVTVGLSLVGLLFELL